MLDVAHRPPPAVGTPVARRRSPRVPFAALAAAALVASMAVSVLLRSSELGLGFWIDEGLSVGIADRPAADIPSVLRQDGSPPLYYVLLHFWMPLFGRSEQATHALSLLFATACIPVAWGFARALFGTRAAWLAAALAATNPFLTAYAQETRMYALVVAFGMVATGAFLAGFVFRRRRLLPVFGAALAAQLYTHNWALFFGVGTGVAWLALVALARGRERRSLLRDGVLAYGAVLLLYAPWVPTLLFQSAHTGAPWALVPRPEMMISAFGRLLGPDARYILLVAAGAGLAVLLRGRAGDAPWRTRLQAEGRAAVVLLVISITTLVVAWLASQLSPAWALRYLSVAVAPLLFLSTLGLARAGGLGLAGAAVVLLMWALDSPPDAKSNVRTVATEITPSLRAGDLVVSTQPEQTSVLAYYLPPGLRYATLWGDVADIGITDWRDGVERLERTDAARDFRPLVDRMTPGQRLVLVRPIIYDRGRWSAPWTELVRYRSLEWERAADNDRRLVAVTHRPIAFAPPAPNPVEATVYVRVAE